MDKQGKTITLKINGKDHHLNQGPPFDENGEGFDSRGAALIESAASQESAEDSFEWILPDLSEPEDIHEYKIAPKQQKKQKKQAGLAVWNKKSNQNKGVLATIILTVFFAILLGSAFGVTILKFVTADSEAKIPAISKAVPREEKPAAGSETLKLGLIPAFVIQNNIFSNEAAAEEMRKSIVAKGISAEIFTVKGQYAIYMGVASSLEEAKKDGETIKAKGVDMYAKPVEIGGGTSASLTADEADFLKQAPEIYAVLLSGSAEHVPRVQEFQTGLSKISDKNTKDQNLLKAKSSIESASKAYVSFQQSKDENQLDEIHNGLLSFLAAYQAIGQ